MNPTDAFRAAVAYNARAITEADADLPEILERFGYEPTAIIVRRAEEDQEGAWLIERLRLLGVDTESWEDLAVAFAVAETIAAYAGRANAALVPFDVMRGVALMLRVIGRRLP